MASIFPDFPSLSSLRVVLPLALIDASILAPVLAIAIGFVIAPVALVNVA